MVSKKKTKDKNFRLRFFFPLFGGILYALGFPNNILPKEFFIFSIIGVFLLFFHLSTLEKMKHKAISLLLFSIFYNIFGFYWISETLHVFGQIFPPFNYLLGLLYSLIIVPQYWAFLLLFQPLFKKITLKTSWKPSPLYTNLIYAITLTLLEYYTPQQFPAHLGHTWLTLAPYLKLSTYFGVGLYSFISYWMVFETITFIKAKKFSLTFLLFIISFMTYSILFPLKKDPTEQSLHIRIVQGNVGNFLKIESEAGDVVATTEVIRRYYNLSTKPTSTPLDLIIWPETAYPFFLDIETIKKDKKLLPFLFKTVIEEMNTELIIGGYSLRHTTDKYALRYEFETVYNSIFHIDENKQVLDHYNKNHLLPFGETLPLGPLTRLASKYIRNLSYFAEGNTYPLFHLKDRIPFIASVCYEILFPQFIKNYIDGHKEYPKFIVNLTNDSWFGLTAEPHQHLFLTRWRAIEFQVPVMRSTNTGISTVITPQGLTQKTSQLNQQEVLDLTVPLTSTGPTFFSKWNNIPLITLAVFIGLFMFLLQCAFSKIRRPKRRQAKSLFNFLLES